MSAQEARVTRLQAGDMHAIIEGGELVSLRAGGHEFMHRAGEPGWGHSDTEMFPIIGPTQDAGYRVQVPRANAVQDQHGLLRELPYERVAADAREAVFRKAYAAGTPVPNSKYPEKSTARWLVWPYAFTFTKRFILTEAGMEVRFEIEAEKDMPFMVGYHPAFRIRSAEAQVEAGGQAIGIAEILEVGDRALPVRTCTEITLQDTKALRIKTEGFGHFMLWSPDPGMICIEPITFYPYDASPAHLHKGFRFLGDRPELFRCVLEPV
ncbi:aldose 1-epimerase [Robiginitalea sp. M366]|uniref:aldose epimerase family protein n=1 Tax=Robiginitalea aestuariiviva TaxID=3036903 RepID=UPI00240E4366|nr:aldose 1-epimerase [Robiginitalea aestuariiviva]MDG1572170.1 aldose 1-epimerase [Robiginitalea aestuariiviva]